MQQRGAGRKQKARGHRDDRDFRKMVAQGPRRNALRLAMAESLGLRLTALVRAVGLIEVNDISAVSSFYFSWMFSSFGSSQY